MENNYDDNKILDFINGRMSATEAAAFRTAISADTALAAEVAFYESLNQVHEVIGDEELAATIAQTTAELEQTDFFADAEKDLTDTATTSTAKVRQLQPHNRSSLRRVLGLAASVLLLISAGFWWANTNYNNAALAGAQFGNTGVSSFMRGAASTEDIFAAGMTALQQENYQAAANFFQTIPDSNVAFNEARLYLALSQFKLKHYASAIENAQLVQQRSERFGTKAQWLEINSRLANSDTSAIFQQQLNDLIENGDDPFYQKQARELKDKLESSWRKLVF